MFLFLPLIFLFKFGYCLSALKQFSYGFVILLVFSTNQIQFLVNHYIVLFVSHSFISTLSLTVSCHQLHFGLFASFTSPSFRCAIKLLVCDIYIFNEGIYYYGLSSQHCPHCVLYDVMPLFSLKSGKLLIFFLFFPDKVIVGQRVLFFQ